MKLRWLASKSANSLKLVDLNPNLYDSYRQPSAYQCEFYTNA
jgi:hypothetical protein